MRTLLVTLLLLSAAPGCGDDDDDATGDGDADADADADSDADSDADVDPGCVYPAGPYGSSEGDILADFLQALPECGAGTPTTLSTFCEAPAIVLHFNAPG